MNDVEYIDAKILDYLHSQNQRQLLAEKKPTTDTVETVSPVFTEQDIVRGILSGSLSYVNNETWPFTPLELWDGWLRIYLPAWFVPWTHSGDERSDGSIRRYSDGHGSAHITCASVPSFAAAP